MLSSSGESVAVQGTGLGGKWFSHSPGRLGLVLHRGGLRVGVPGGSLLEQHPPPAPRQLVMPPTAPAHLTGASSFLSHCRRIYLVDSQNTEYFSL